MVQTFRLSQQLDAVMALRRQHTKGMTSINVKALVRHRSHSVERRGNHRRMSRSEGAWCIFDRAGSETAGGSSMAKLRDQPVQQNLVDVCLDPALKALKIDIRERKA